MQILSTGNTLNNTDNIIHPITGILRKLHILVYSCYEKQKNIHLKPHNRELSINNRLRIFSQSVHKSITLIVMVIT